MEKHNREWMRMIFKKKITKIKVPILNVLRDATFNFKSFSVILVLFRHFLSSVEKIFIIISKISANYWSKFNSEITFSWFPLNFLILASWKKENYAWWCYINRKPLFANVWKGDIINKVTEATTIIRVLRYFTTLNKCNKKRIKLGNSW